ncbi:hypothetical protein PSH03_003822 [Micromonospora sp. PSH03]|uniref:hypothetical protein n=1 Tax=Micromonospora salmantinae TaxID=2911211 RepID=UPI001EE8E647|nr:hypothetical protein [Micromonospora salmantinae]MCG5454660.1 hypothetical protein [Micromonospora salmantinae]
MPDDANLLRLRWAILGPPLATVLMLGVVVVVGVVRGSDPELWMRPVVLAPGGPLVLLWWQAVVRPRHRWWALGVALAVTIVAYLLLYRLVLAGLPFPWDGVVSFAVAGRLGAFAYVTVTQRPRMPLARGKAAGGSMIASGGVYEERFGFTRRDLLLMPTSAVFAAVGVVLFRDEPLPGLGAIVLGGMFLLLRFVTVRPV